jgi:phosphatidylglycerol---prolipoprotein diacylglyceryl transferase
MLTYPGFDPIAFSLGPVRVHWYGIMYVIGFAAAWWLARRRAARPGSTWTAIDVDDLIFYAMLGVILGGRIGYLLFYSEGLWLREPLYILQIWKGGMSFHGGLAGVIIATALFARSRKRHVADVFDFTAALPGIGLFAGRIGNFINGELWGKPTDVPWGFLVNGVVRHATQLYEAVLEGLLLFAVLWWFTSTARPRLAASGLFLVLYGMGRTIVEFWRLPDENIGYLFGGWLTMGMLLSLPLILAGLVLLTLAYRRREASGNLVAA